MLELMETVRVLRDEVSESVKGRKEAEARVLEALDENRKALDAKKKAKDDVKRLSAEKKKAEEEMNNAMEEKRKVLEERSGEGGAAVVRISGESGLGSPIRMLFGDRKLSGSGSLLPASISSEEVMNLQKQLKQIQDEFDEMSGELEGVRSELLAAQDKNAFVERDKREALTKLEVLTERVTAADAAVSETLEKLAVSEVARGEAVERVKALENRALDAERMLKGKFNFFQIYECNLFTFFFEYSC